MTNMPERPERHECLGPPASYCSPNDLPSLLPGARCTPPELGSKRLPTHGEFLQPALQHINAYARFGRHGHHAI